MLSYVDIEEVYQSVNIYISKHPKATEEQVNQYTLKQIRKLYAKSESNKEITTQSSISGNTLNPEEKNYSRKIHGRALKPVTMVR